MDTETAIETRIEPRLIEAFGQQIANSVLTRATLCYVTVTGGERERYEALVRSVCSNEHIVSVWGAEVAARQEKEWRALVAESGLADDST